MILIDGGRAILRVINFASLDRHLNPMRYRQEINKEPYDTLSTFRSKSFVANLGLMSLTLRNRIIKTYSIGLVRSFIILVGQMVYLPGMRTLPAWTVARLGFVETFGWRRLVMR